MPARTKTKANAKQRNQWQRRTFSGTRQRTRHGHAKNLPANSTPLTIFKRIFDDSIVSNVLFGTNSRLREKRKREVTTKEFFLYLAVILMMGWSPRPRLKDYWAFDSDGLNGCLRHEWIASRMARDRFLEIHQNLRIPEEQLDLFMKRVQTNGHRFWDPASYYTCDEVVVAFLGRCRYRVHMKRKPNQTGVKIWMVI